MAPNANHSMHMDIGRLLPYALLHNVNLIHYLMVV